MTGLETVFVGLGSLVVGVIGTIIVMSRNFVSCAVCAARHDTHASDAAKNKADIRLAFEILREIVVRLPGVTESEKARILNLRPAPAERSE